MRTYTNVFDLGDLKSALAEAFEIKKDRYKYEALGRHKTCLLIFFNNSLRTRLSTQKAARNLGMDVIVLDVNQGAWKLETERGVVMDGDKSEHLLEAIPVMASYCDVIGVRSFARFESREDDYTEKILNQFIRYSGKPVFSMEAATGHPLQAFADLITIEEYKRKERPKVVLTWAPHPRALPQAVPNSFADFMKNYPTHSMAPDAQYYLAECYFQRNQFPDAALAYDTVITKFSKSNRTPGAYLKQGICFSKMNQKAAAKARMNELIKKYPNSPEAARAKNFLKTNK